MKKPEKKSNFNWSPTEKQDVFLSCPADEVLYGGAAGGGKTDALIMAAIGPHDVGFFVNPNWHVLVLRRTFPELETSIIHRSLQLLYGKARYDGVKHRWVSSCGGVIQFGHVKTEADIYKHQGAQYNRIIIDELTHFTERMFLFLMSRLRTTDPRLHCQMLSASNPGGLGHGWVKKRFIDNKEPYDIHEEQLVMPDGSGKPVSRCYIPATVYDNPHLMDNDPNYVVRLMNLSETERRAYLHGDWDIFSGQFFTDFTEDHVCEPFDIPFGWPMWIAMDYGYATKCSIGFYTQDPISETYYRWDEIYVSKVAPDSLARMIKEKLGRHFVSLAGKFADKRIMVKDETVEISTREKFAFNGIYFQLANDNRVEGWHRVRELLMKRPDGEFNFKVFSNCKEFIRVIPEMVHDENKPEDINKHGECHIADELRYFAIMRKVSQMDYSNAPEVVLHPRTGYVGMVGQKSPLSGFVKRLANCKPGVNYFLDRVPEPYV